MRPIKFRFRYTDGKNWIFHILTMEEIMNGEPFNIMSDNPLLKHFKLKGEDEFTGLLDKNEKEIYEGDIIKDYNSIYTIRSYVRYPGAFWLVGKGEDPENHGCGDYSYLLGYSDTSYYSVIGNIYENADLLLQEKSI